MSQPGVSGVHVDPETLLAEPNWPHAPLREHTASPGVPPDSRAHDAGGDARHGGEDAGPAGTGTGEDPAITTINDISAAVRRVDAPPKANRLAKEDYMSEEERAGIFSVMFFNFLNPLLRTGVKRQLNLDDLPKLHTKLRSDNIMGTFYTAWAEEQKKPSPSLFRAYFAVIGKLWWSTVPFLLIQAIGPFSSPIILEYVLDSFEDPESEWYYVVAYVSLMSVALLLVALSTAQMFRRVFQMAISLDACNVNALFRKGLYLSNTARQERSQGQIMNHLSTDAQTIFNFTGMAAFVWVMPIQLGIALYMLFERMGVATWVALGVMIASGPINAVLGLRFRKLAKRKLARTDERLKLLNDIIGGIRLVKFYAWESSFMKRVEAIRSKETDVIRSYLYNMAGLMASIGFVPVLVAMGTFGTYAALGNTLSAGVVFPTLTLLQLLQMPLSMLPLIIGMLMSASVSVRRVKNYLLAQERTAVPNTPEEAAKTMRKILGDGEEAANTRILIENGVFRWKDPSVLTEEEKKEKAAAEKKKAREDKKLGKGKKKKGAVDPEVDVEMATTKTGVSGDDGSSATTAQNTEASPAALTGDTPDVHTGADADETNNASDGVDESLTLPKVNLRVKKGELVMIVGPVGCGKSSVLAALLGDMTCMEGHVAVSGTTAYVGQRPWISTQTVRNNIVGAKEYDKKWFDKVVRACELEDDIKLLAAGVETQIGERGINLSGGQLARMSLAQALYADADVYILDDVLSAVDAHVGRKIFASVLHPKTGMLRHKAVLLVTNQLQFLPDATWILAMDEKRRVAETGTFTDLMEAGLNFMDLIHRHARHMGEEENAMEEASTPASAVLESPMLRTPAAGARRSDRQMSTISHVSLEEPLNEESKEMDAATLARRETAALAGQLVDEEDRAAGAVAVRIYRKLISHAGGPGLIALYLSLMVLAVGARMGGQGWISVWTDGTWFPGQGHMWYIMMYGIIVGVGLVFQASVDLTFAHSIVRGVTDMHHILFTRVVRAPVRFFDTTPTGRIVNRFSKDVFQMDMEMPNFLSAVLNFSFMLSIMLLMVAVVVYPVLIVLLPAVYGFSKITTYYRASAREMQRLDGVSKSFVVAQFSETLNGISTIWAYDLKEKYMQTTMSKIDENHRAFYNVKILVRWLNLRTGTMGAGVLLGCGVAMGLMRDMIPASFAGLAITLLQGVMHMLNGYVQQLTELETRMTSVERILSFAEVDAEAPSVIEGSRPPVDWPAQGAIQFKDYSMRYRENLDLVIDKLNVSVKAGEKLGVVGRTGAGKSSLAIALFRIVEAANGSITIDGVDVASIGLEDLRSKMAIIPQQPFMFEGSVRFNLDPFEEHSDEEIWAVLDIVQVKSEIESLAGGLEEPVKEGGSNFSVGQRQLVCIARALLRKSQIIILDEATASVDVDTDSVIQKMVREEFKHCTVITIAHRLNTVVDSDRILVMDKGKAAELGSPHELLQKDGSLFGQLVDETGAENAAHLRQLAAQAAGK